MEFGFALPCCRQVATTQIPHHSFRPVSAFRAARSCETNRFGLTPASSAIGTSRCQLRQITLAYKGVKLMIRPLGSILALTITAWLPLSDSQAAMAQQDGNTVDPGKLLTAAMNEPESDGNESPRGRGSRDSGRNRDASAHADRGRTGESERRRGTTGQPGASQKNRSAKNTQSEKEADKPRRSTDATGRRGSEKYRGHEHKDHRFSAGERKRPLPHGPGISRESRGPRPGRSTIQHDHTGHRTSGFSGRHHSVPSPRQVRHESCITRTATRSFGRQARAERSASSRIFGK